MKPALSLNAVSDVLGPPERMVAAAARAIGGERLCIRLSRPGKAAHIAYLVEALGW